MATSDPPPGRRLDPDARRGQLLGAALELLKTRPFDEISQDEVARSVGVSKGLVFHYFPSKSDLQAAVLRKAAAELLAGLDIDPTLPPGQRLRAGLEAFVNYIEQQPGNYLAITRRAGSDPKLAAIFEDTRAAIVGMIASTVGLPDPPPGLRIVIRGWIAMVEEAVLHWLEGAPVPRQELLGFLERAAVTMLPDALVTFAHRAVANDAAG